MPKMDLAQKGRPQKSFFRLLLRRRRRRRRRLRHPFLNQQQERNPKRSGSHPSDPLKRNLPPFLGSARQEVSGATRALKRSRLYLLSTACSGQIQLLHYNFTHD